MPVEPTLDPLAAAFARVRVLLLDFDGVLTDNRVTVDETGRESVTCWRGDGIGLRAVERVGVVPIVVSTEPNRVVAVRCEKLRVECHHGVEDKRSFVTSLLDERGVPAAEAAFVGNDVNDAGVLSLVGLPIVVADAHPDVRGLARYVTRTRGGYGAVREVCDRIAAARAEREVAA